MRKIGKLSKAVAAKALIVSLASVANMLAQPAPPAVQKRIDFTKFAADAAKLASLRKGFAAMIALDNGVADKDLSPLGWKWQAYVHGVPADVTTQATWTVDENDIWDTCQHSTWFFLAWHRMELFYFERILRVMAGDATLTLPYWNFSVPAAVAAPPVGAKLPVEFRFPADATTNSLWFMNRNTALNKVPGPGAADNAMPLDGTVATTLNAFKQPAFFTNVIAMGGNSFGGGAIAGTRHGPGKVGRGQIEQVPHDQVHMAVGDGTAKSMSNASGAGLDPIFWPIHANIDRAWACWQQLNPGTEPKAGAWLTRPFDFFDVDGTGKPVRKSMTGKDIIDTAMQLMYMYDDACSGFQRPGVAPNSLPHISSLLRESSGGAESQDTAVEAVATFLGILEDKPASVRIKVSPEIQARIDAVLKGGALPGSIILTVGGVAIDDISAGPSYGIYIGLPDGGFPDERGGYYVAQLSYFGVGHHHRSDEHQDNSVSFDVTELVKGLIDKGEWRPDEVHVTFANNAALYPDRVKAPPATAKARARFSSVRLTVQ